MNAAVRWPAVSNCSQNSRIALVAVARLVAVEQRLALLELADRARVGSKHSDSSSLSGLSRASRNG